MMQQPPVWVVVARHARSNPGPDAQMPVGTVHAEQLGTPLAACGESAMNGRVFRQLRFTAGSTKPRLGGVQFGTSPGRSSVAAARWSGVLTLNQTRSESTTHSAPPGVSLFWQQ